MSHSAPPPHSRRRLELAGGAIAVIAGVLILVLAFVALKHPKGRDAGKASQSIPASTVSPSASASPSVSSAKTSASTSPSTSASTNASPASSAPVVPGVTVVVLNNTSRAGLTATAISRLRAGGWKATDGGSFEGDIISTAAYYDPNIAGARFAADKLQAQFPAIKRVKPKFDQLPSGPVILMLTSDYS